MPPLQKLVVATHNKGKLKEFAALLSPYIPHIPLVSALELDLPEPLEDGESFEANALLKARAVAKASGHAALADDSGLCVNALGGAPGVYSGRYAEGPNGRDYKLAMRRIHDGIGGNPDRAAAFVCVLALAELDGRTEIFEGRCDGTIVWPPRGKGGHGYDPIFMPRGETRTLAEMGEAEKNALSHRGRAAEKFILWLRKKTP